MFKKFIPDMYVSSIFDIPYNKLYEQGKRLILTDLDNTLISYIKTDPTEELFKWKEQMALMGFEVIIVSNSRKDRVKHFAEILGYPYVKFAKKPLKGGLKKAIKMASRKYDKAEIMELGDQLMTDVCGSRRLGIYTILVQAIDKKTEKLVTRFNRFWERLVIRFIKVFYKKEFKEKLMAYAKENHNIC